MAAGERAAPLIVANVRAPQRAAVLRPGDGIRGGDVLIDLSVEGRHGSRACHVGLHLTGDPPRVAFPAHAVPVLAHKHVVARAAQSTHRTVELSVLVKAYGHIVAPVSGVTMISGVADEVFRTLIGRHIAELAHCNVAKLRVARWRRELANAPLDAAQYKKKVKSAIT